MKTRTVTATELKSLPRKPWKCPAGTLANDIEIISGESFTVLPISTDIPRDAARLLPVLRDPADTFIAATARAHGLRLLTSDARIVETNCVSTIP